MILLPQQFQMLVLHLVMGWCFGLLFSFESALTLHIPSQLLQKATEFVFVTLFFLLFYYALYSLNGGMSHFYCLILFGLGIFVYMKFYLMTFSPLIKAFVLFFAKLNGKLLLAFSKCLDIINIRVRLRKWRGRLGKRKNKKHGKKKNAEKADHPSV